MNNKVVLFCLLALSMATTACQSKSYKIEGTVEGLADGDTLFLTSDLTNGTPFDTLVVKEGKFESKSETDTVGFVMLYASRRNEFNMPFFIEPGTIKITLSDNPQKAKVSGTGTNEKWQEFNDSTINIGMEMNRIASEIYGSKLTPEEQKAKAAEMGRLNAQYKKAVVDCAEKNIDNELGCFILTYYPEEVVDGMTAQRLLEKMPDKFKQRKAIKELVSKIEKAAKYAVGKSIDDFSMQNLEGKTVSIMQEIGRNKITVIDFWASWCGPCRSEMPMMVGMYGKYKAQGFGIVGVSLDSDKGQWAKATETLGIKWPQMSDLKGWDNAAARMFNVSSIPYTIVVDNKGVILQKGLRGSELEEYVASKLGKNK